MTLAFVLIASEIGAEAEVYEALKKLPEVKEVYMIYGGYDLIAKVEAEDMDKLREAVIMKIRRMDKVRSTQTMIVMK